MDTDTVEDAFAVLASQLRLRILEALADDREYAFTELYEAVEAENTSQFAYHLERLRSRYVRRTDDGYAITDAGRRIVQLSRAGEYTGDPELDPVTVDTYCPDCGETPATAVADGRLATVDCETCSRNLLRYELRPAHVADRSPREALEAADRGMRARYSAAIEGHCLQCGGGVDIDLVAGAKADPATALVACQCRHCGVSLSAPAALAVFHHPALVSRFHEAGERLPATPTWELLRYVPDLSVRVDGPSAVTVDVSGCSRPRSDGNATRPEAIRLDIEGRVIFK